MKREIPLNRHALASHGDRVAMLRPPTQSLTPSECLDLAAWLVVMATCVENEEGYRPMRAVLEDLADRVEAVRST